MERLLLWIGLAGAAAAVAAQTEAPSAPPAPAPPVLIAVVDYQRLAQESNAGKEAASRLQKLADQKKQELDKFENEARELVEKLNTQGPPMSEDKREALAKQADDKQKAWKRTQEDAQRDFQAAEQKETRALAGRLLPFLREFCKEKRYGLVLDARAGILYSDESVDITNEVLRRFNTTIALPPPLSPRATAAPSKKSLAPAAKPTAAPKKP